jgi:predicted unusual protein kinase regulating ubiquinone biosynthesis (AarF/ABC1/UbiB family)
MKYQDKIATGRTERTMQFLGTGAKVGGNYLKYYTKKLFTDGNDAKKELHDNNAEDIYNSLTELKGSALKVAQMLSLDKGILPQAYTKKFSLSQYSAKPLSGPLVVKTFQKYLGKKPQNLFDSFSLQANNAASIGQVHQAKLDGKKLAVKIQYPGIGQSIESDLKIVKPIAKRMFQISEKEMMKYLAEVQEKLLEETDYEVELERSVEISEACNDIPNLFFPHYYPELSSKKILTMDWLKGDHLDKFLKKNPSQEVRNQIGQALWDFYSFQIHHLKTVHADPHPGNFLFTEDGKVGIIDFGCVKVLPVDFYHYYFSLILPETQNNKKVLNKVMTELEMVFDTDTESTKKIFTEAFQKMTNLLSLPFHGETFNFGNKDYIDQIYQMSEELSQQPELRKSKEARGSRHMLYINRTYFGLYTILHELGADIKTGIGDWSKPIVSAVSD